MYCAVASLPSLPRSRCSRSPLLPLPAAPAPASRRLSSPLPSPPPPPPQKWGFPISSASTGAYDEFLPIIAFVEKFGNFAKSQGELQIMSNIWFGRCSLSGWDIPHNECAWSSTLTDAECSAPLKVEGRTIERRSRDDAIKILGTLVSCDGRMDFELGHRISAVWNTFHQHRDTLCCKDVPIGKRIELLKTVAEPALYWCARTWKLTFDQNSMLRGVQRQMLMKMMRPRRRRDELDDEFHPRLQSVISKAMEKTTSCRGTCELETFTSSGQAQSQE